MSSNQSKMENKICSRIKGLQFSVIREMSQRAANMTDCISLGIGEPDFDTPQEVIQRAMQDVQNGYTHYAPAQGDPELLKLLSEKFSAETGMDIPVANIVVTPGGMGSLSAALQAVLEPDDEVLIPEPYFPAYKAHVIMAGGRVVPVPTTFDNGFTLRAEDLQRAVTSKTKVLILNSPNNPTGNVLDRQTLDELAEIIRDKELIVLSDEVYDRMVFEGQFESIVTRPGMAEQTLVIKSCSKTFAMTGWRVGFAFGPSWLMPQVIKVVNYATTCVNTPGQRAALAALSMDQEPFLAMSQSFQRRVEFLWSRVQDIPGIRCHRPAGSFYLFPDISSLNPDSTAFALSLLEKEKVLVIPGSAFGRSGQGCVRIAGTVGEKRLEEAMNRLQRYVTNVGQKTDA
ncbi:MAG: pyridoxal phosphate-dependent aminotransferase [Desulfovermiculus sp.]|nr:pyridoxal phosphate-dependent aminotransferase [Desulfovermiculus sp.]